MRAEALLPDHIDETTLNGVTIRKGTVGAFLMNARLILDPKASVAARDSAYQDVEDAIPALQALGIFEILEVRDPHMRAFINRKRGAC